MKYLPLWIMTSRTWIDLHELYCLRCYKTSVSARHNLVSHIPMLKQTLIQSLPSHPPKLDSYKTPSQLQAEQSPVNNY